MNIAKESTGNIINSFVGLLVAIIYAVVIAFIAKYKNLREKKSNQLLLNLSIGHFLAGFFHFYGLFTLNPVRTYVLSSYVYSIAALLFLSVDRLFFIQYPFWYNNPTSNPIHIGFMLASPIAGGAYLIRKLSSAPKRHQDVSFTPKQMLSFIVSFLGTITILLILNFIVFAIIRKQRKRICFQNTSSFNVWRDAKTTNPTPKNSTLLKFNKNQTRKREARAFYSCFGCVITFSLLWLPCAVIVILQRFGDLHVSDGEFKFYLALAGCNPLFDLLVFIWFNVELRTAIKKSINMKQIFPQKPN